MSKWGHSNFWPDPSEFSFDSKTSRMVGESNSYQLENENHADFILNKMADELAETGGLSDAAMGRWA